MCQGKTVCTCRPILQELAGGSLGHYNGVVTKIAPTTGDTNIEWQSSEEENKSSSYLALLTSEEEDPPARYDPEPVDTLTYQPLGSRNMHDTNIQWESSGEEQKSSSYLVLLTSEDEATPARYDPESVDAITYDPLGSKNIHEPLYLDNIEPSLSEFTGLVDSNEPVTSDYGSWGMRAAEDSNHRTAPSYRYYEDESDVVGRGCYASEDDDVVMSSHSVNFGEAPPGPYLDQGGGGNDLPPKHNAVKVLMKKINSIKKKIKHFEEDFETDFGFRPSHSEKMKHKKIKKYMIELSKSQKELKQMKNDAKGLVSVPSTFPLSVLSCQESTNSGSQPTVPGQVSASAVSTLRQMEERNKEKRSACAASTLRQVEERLKEKRSACGRKENLFEMTSDELLEEKTALQKALLHYEYINGRPKTREDRDLARPLYDRYRQCKRIVFRAESQAKENMGNLATIVEHETMDFTLASPQYCGSIGQEEEEEKAILTTPIFEEEDLMSPPQIEDKENNRPSLILEDLHSLTHHELKKRKKENKEENKRLRRTLRDFEEQFEMQYGRKVQKEDRGPQEQTYLDYKHSKAKLKLLEALISKLNQM